MSRDPATCHPSGVPSLSAAADDAPFLTLVVVASGGVDRSDPSLEVAASHSTSRRARPRARRAATRRDVRVASRARAGVARAAPALSRWHARRSPARGRRGPDPGRPRPASRRAAPRGPHASSFPPRRARLAPRAGVRTRGDLAPRRADANAVVLAPTASADDDDDDDAVSAIDDLPPSDSDSDALGRRHVGHLRAAREVHAPDDGDLDVRPDLSMVDTAVVGTASTPSSRR